MATVRSKSGIEWLIHPWLAGRGALARAARVGAVALLLTALLLPSMIAMFGLDGWWWDSTLSICVLTPAGIILFDNLTELFTRVSGRRVPGLLRLVLLAFGFVAGNIAGYLVILLWRMTPGRTPQMLVADFTRNMRVLAPALAVVIGVGASLWYRAEAYRLESAAAAASYRVLKGQMQPHFLFNALNALKELISDDPEQARAFTQRLADLYRMILQLSNEATAPLADELAVVSHYLEIERVRYGDRLRYVIDTPAELASEHVPSLLLQTLAENAVKHGIAKARGGGEVRICARRRDAGMIELEVSNTGAPFEPERERDHDAAPATGLSNTRARLQLMYGSAAELSIVSDPELGTRVRLVVSGAKLG
jgi:signal transduction histidine kinase